MRVNRTSYVICLVLVFLAPALAWAPGTHAYLANRLKGIADPANVMFGGMTPDINQVVSTNPLSAYFYATHYPAHYPTIPDIIDQGFLDLWAKGKAVGTPQARSLGFGFATHNEAWGADYYAHIKSHLYPGYSNPKYPGQNGYVWVKAAQLCRLMKAQLSAAGISNPELDSYLSDTANCHAIVEYGIDLALKGTRDPLIGTKVLTAVGHDADTMKGLFIATYKQDMTLPYAAPMGVILAGAESTWSDVMTYYGNALSLPMDQAVPAVAAFLELVAENQVLGTLPPATRQLVTTVIELGLVDSFALCAYDLNLELDLTVMSVRYNLAAHGVTY